MTTTTTFARWRRGGWAAAAGPTPWRTWPTISAIPGLWPRIAHGRSPPLAGPDCCDWRAGLPPSARTATLRATCSGNARQVRCERPTTAHRVAVRLRHHDGDVFHRPQFGVLAVLDRCLRSTAAP